MQYTQKEVGQSDKTGALLTYSLVIHHVGTRSHDMPNRALPAG